MALLLEHIRSKQPQQQLPLFAGVYSGLFGAVGCVSSGHGSRSGPEPPAFSFCSQAAAPFQTQKSHADKHR